MTDKSDAESRIACILKREIRDRIPEYHQIRAVALTLLIATSMISGVVMFGTQPIRDGHGTVEAASTDATISQQCDVDLGEELHTSPTWADIDDDDNDELLVGTSDGVESGTHNPSTLYAIDVSSTGCSVKWQVAGDDWFHGGIAVADANGDGDKTIFVGNNDGGLRAIGTDGTVKENYALGNMNVNSPTLHDIDGDGNLEVLAGHAPGDLTALDFDGTSFTEKWSYRGYNETDQMFGAPDITPPVGDFTGDGTVEIGFVTASNSDDSSEFVMIDTDGTVVDRYDMPALFARQDPVLADINGDGNLNFVGATQDKFDDANDAPKLIALDKNNFGANNETWRISLSDTSEADHPFPSVSAYDFTGDGKKELIFGRESDTLEIRDGTDGSILHEYDVSEGQNNPHNDQYNIESEPKVSDVDGDGEAEVIVGTNDNRTLILSHDLSTVEDEFVVETDAAEDFESDPALADADNDGRMEVAIGNFNGHLYVLQVDEDGDGPEWKQGLRGDTVETTEVGVFNQSKNQIGNATTISAQVTDQDDTPIENATVEVWLANEDEIQRQMELSAQEAEEKADELLHEARNIEPDQFDENRKVMEDDAAYGDFSGEGVLVHDASEWELSGYETRFGVISRDLTPDLGGPGTVHSADERLVLSVWDVGAGSLLEDDVDGAVDGAKTADSERTIVIEQVDGPTKIDDRTVMTREFVEITDAANSGTKTHYAASVDLPKGFYRIYLEGQSESATYHSVGSPDEVSGLIENDIQDDADQYTSRAQDIRDHINDGIFDRQRVKTDANGEFEIILTGQIAIQAYKSDAPNVQPGQMSVEEIRDLHETEQHLGAVYYSPTPKHVDTREVNDGETVEVGVIRTGGLPQQDLGLAEEIMNELRGYIEDQIPVNTDMDVSGTGAAELESTRDTLLSMVEGNEAAEEILANTAPEHTTNGEVDLRPVSDYSSDSAGYSDQIHALRTALDRAPSSTDTETDGSIEDDVLNMRLTTGGIRDGADVEDVEVFVHWQDGTSEPIPSDYWHIESNVASGDAVVVKDYPIPSDRATATVEVIAETGEGEVARGQERFENPAFDGEHLRFRSITASTLSPGPSEPVTVRPRLESGSSATLANATVRAPDGTIVNSTVTTDDTVRFDTSGEGAHSIRLEYDEAGTTWVKSTRINSRSAGLDTPPQVRELNDDGQYALASGLEDAEVADEAGGTETRMTAVIGAGEHAPSVVHYHPDLDDSDETIRVEVKAGEYRETVNNRVSTAVHVDLSDDALVWIDGDPIDEDGTTSAGSIQTTNGSEIVRTMTDENGETTVRVVQDPTFVQEITHNIGTWLATLTIAPIGGMALTVVEVVATVLSSWTEVAATAAIPTAAAASEVIA